jgi:regulator of sigma D
LTYYLQWEKLGDRVVLLSTRQLMKFRAISAVRAKEIRVRAVERGGYGFCHKLFNYLTKTE